ncbi:recombinase family protein [Amnibacterium sp.]|uniref:recombinase family protein n=1 Tax=Amnibacterium sp. TaxID=1872496 RepID=UPI003F7C2205
MSRRLVTYLRLSNATDASSSIARQRADLAAYASREGLVQVGEFVDDGVSGRKARENADAAVRMLAEDEADVLAVAALDRFSRQGATKLGALLDVLEARPEARFVSLKEGDSGDPTFRLRTVILAEIARTEAENTAARARSAHAYRRTVGRFAGSTVPFGFRSVRATEGAPGQVLVPAPDEVAIVEEVAARILADESLTAIARDLGDRGIPTARSAYRRAVQIGEDPTGLDRGTWWVSTVSTTWRSPHLLGQATHKGRVLLGDDHLPRKPWEALVDRRTFDALEARLAPQSQRPQRRRAARLLSGFLACRACGRTMYVNAARQVHYGCAHGKSAERGPAPQVAADALDAYVEGLYLGIVGDAPEWEVVTALDDTRDADLAEVAGALREATAAMIEKGADRPALLGRIEALVAQRDEIEATPRVMTTERRRTGRTLRDAWGSSSLDERRALLGEAIGRIEIGPGRPGRHGIDPARVRVFWNS